MPIDVIMPQMGESITEGTLVTWLKKEGEAVQRDEPLFEISTDKVDAEIPSPAAGTLGTILIHESETVAVGTIVATILAPGEAAVTGDGAASAGTTGNEQQGAATERPTPAEERAATSSPRPEAQADGASVSRGQPAPAGPEVTAVSQQAEAPGGTADGRGQSKEELRRVRSSPLVRNIAAEHGIELAAVRGTGLSGRVTKQDILAFVAERERAPRETAAVPLAATPAPPAVAAARPAAGPPASAAPPAVGGAAPRPFGDNDRVELEPMSIMRKKIAEHMTLSQRTSAHVTSFFEIDLTRVNELRRVNKPSFLEDSGVNLTFMPFIIKALVAGIKEWPILNASVWEDQIVYKKDINVGIAVALEQPGGFGLLVPVIRHADELSLVGLARAANDLAVRARSKKLLPDEVQGGTITITNPGVFGSMAGTPIINQPQVAILGVGAIEKRVKVVGPDDAIGVRTCAFFSISYDHRVVDGATADHFMLVVKDRLENFSDPSLKESGR